MLSFKDIEFLNLQLSQAEEELILSREKAEEILSSSGYCNAYRVEIRHSHDIEEKSMRLRKELKHLQHGSE